MEWTLTDDAAGVFQEHIDLKNWQNDLMEVAKYFYENRSLVLNAYHSISRDVLEEYIRKIIFPLVDLYYLENYAGNSIPQQDRQFIVDLYTFGIAGGRRYLHINANGDVDPCVFIHYSNANIRDMTLLEALQSPIFMAYHDGQPFNENHRRPCTMLENPELLKAMVEKTGAHSTDLQSPESAEHLCAKCTAYAKDWTATADKLWTASQQK